jgi:hypothetical protein
MVVVLERKRPLVGCVCFDIASRVRVSFQQLYRRPSTNSSSTATTVAQISLGAISNAPSFTCEIEEKRGRRSEEESLTATYFFYLGRLSLKNLPIWILVYYLPPPSAQA